MTQIYVDSQTLARIAGVSPEPDFDSEDYLEFLEAVRKEVIALPESDSRVIIMYYFECRSIEEIAGEIGIGDTDIKMILRRSLLTLKSRLDKMVRARWPRRFADNPKCRICRHPQKDEIERILREKAPSESWGSVNSRLKSKLGLSFNPPSILISHMRYHMKE